MERLLQDRYTRPPRQNGRGGLQAVPRLPSRECEIHAGWRSAPSACRDRPARLLQPLYRIVSADDTAASPERAGGLQAVPRLPSRECEIHAGWRSAPSACRDRAARLLQPLYRIVSADRRRSHRPTALRHIAIASGASAASGAGIRLLQPLYRIVSADRRRRPDDCRVVSAKSMQAGDRHPPRVAIARRDFFNRSTGSSRQTDDVHAKTDRLARTGGGAFRRCHDCRVLSAKSMQAGDRHPPRVAIARRDFFNRSTGSSRQTDDVRHLASTRRGALGGATQVVSAKSRLAIGTLRCRDRPARLLQPLYRIVSADRRRSPGRLARTGGGPSGGATTAES